MINKTLTLDLITAKKLYPTASSELKIIFEENFGKKSLIDKLIDRITTIEEVYEELGRKMPTLKDYKFLPEKKQVKALNTQYIEDISELFNEEWVPNFLNPKEYKYYPYFERNTSSWLVSYCGYRNYYSFMGSGFYYKDSEIALYCGNQFLDIYSKVLD